MSDALSFEASRLRRGDQRPNILMLFSDEHHYGMSGFMGHPVVQTPNLDGLAAEGVVFENAYCNSPLCSPSRQSFLAGLYCHEIDMWNNTSAMPEDTVTWAHMLSAGGYETSLVGKMHFNGYQKMYGFDRRPVLEGNNEGESFYSWGLRTSHDWRDPLPYRSGKNGMWDELMEAGPDGPERQPVFQRDREVVEGTVRLLEEKAADPAGRPWAICCGFVLPHPPWRARADLLARYRGKGDLPFNVEGAGRDTCDRHIQHYTGNLMNLPEPAIRTAREVYWALIGEFDEHCGVILDALERLGLAENTAVFYFSDHGEMAGEHGLWGKVTLLESSIRIPLVARWKGHFGGGPGQRKRQSGGPLGRRIGELVSLVDLFPTFLELGGVSLPEPLYTSGHSLVPLLSGQGSSGGGEVFCEFEGEGWNHPRACLRVGRYKYVYNHTAEQRLYDLQADPYEMNDLAGEPAHAATLAELRARLLSQWDPDAVERRVLRAQARRKIARCRNVCKDLGW